MKFTLLFLIVLLSFSVLIADNLLEISVSGNFYYNVLRISSFDVKNPQNQPIFFTVTGRNISGEVLSNIRIKFALEYNSSELLSSTVRYKSDLPQGQSFTFTNRDVFTELESPFFGSPSPKIEVSDVIDALPNLKDTILNTGLFPDGSYALIIQFVDADSNPISDESSLSFTVRNPGGIFLISPGSRVGSNIPVIGSTPVNFIWSSNLINTYDPATGVGNKFNLIVKEFDDTSLLAPGSIETSGEVVLSIENLTGNFYNEFSNFRNNRYYAWQISTGLIDPSTGDFSAPNAIKSNYNVFKYESEAEGAMSEEEATNLFLLFLANLNLQDIMNLIGEGYRPTGTIEFQNKTYTGSNAEAVIRELMTRQIESITIVD